MVSCVSSQFSRRLNHKPSIKAITSFVRHNKIVYSLIVKDDFCRFQGAILNDYILLMASNTVLSSTSIARPEVGIVYYDIMKNSRNHVLYRKCNIDFRITASNRPRLLLMAFRRSAALFLFLSVITYIPPK